MRTLIFYIFLALMLVLFLSKPELTIKPFSLKFNQPWTALGWLCIIAGMTMVVTEASIKNYEEDALKYYEKGYLKGYKKGAKEMHEQALNTIEEVFKEAKNK